MERCSVCGSALPPVALKSRDPFCSRPCAQEHHGTGEPAERARAAKAQFERHIEDGTDATALELRRVTVDERQQLLVEGRYSEEFLRAFAAYLIAHRDGRRVDTVTWFSPRGSGPTMRRWEDEDVA